MSSIPPFLRCPNCGSEDIMKNGTTRRSKRFNNTLRQRVSRLVRQTLSFSKNLDHHISAIWNLIHYYNEQIRLEQASC